MQAYLTDLSVFLPNAPVASEDIENVLGRVGGLPSRTRAIILRSNKIKTRYYALDPQTGGLTHTNAQLTAAAVRGLKPRGDFRLDEIECLACGTSSPDLLNPGHASMVHGELGIPPLEIASSQGVCLSGIQALKYAVMNVALGLAKAAVATGSELASSFIRAAFYQGPVRAAEEVEKKPWLAFDAEFLRWMLSDGAGAALVEPRPRSDGLSLQVEWIEQLSCANELPTCMYIGGRKEPDGSVTGWRALGSLKEAIEGNFMAVRQDVELLNREIIPTSTERVLTRILRKHPLRPEDIDWFLPHYSSDYFRNRLYDEMKKMGFDVPQDRWFTNLETKGNTGAASIYIILEELFKSGRLRPEQRLLCFIPESGRFSIAYMLLTVVEA